MLAIAALSQAQQASDFDGTWVLRSSSQNIFSLTLKVERGVIAGSLTKPKALRINQEGDFTSIGAQQVTLPVQKSRTDSGQLELFIDDDRFVMTRDDRDHASIVLEGMRPWMLERAAERSKVLLAKSLQQPKYAKNIRELRTQLSNLVKQDQDARLAFDEARMKVADAKCRPELIRMFSRYGWVTNSLAGKAAAHNFWLLVQHQEPELQQRFLPALENASHNGDASMSDYAYLYDRVQVGQGKQQRWGTQVECREGKPELPPVEDPASLNARRKDLFLLPIGEYLKSDYLVKLCAQTKK